MILDGHIHVDEICSTLRHPDRCYPIDVEETIKYLRDCSVDCAIIIYRNYSTLEYIHTQVPNCRILGLKWVDIPLNTKYYNEISKTVLEDIDKEMFYGLKFHDLRVFDKEMLTDCELNNSNYTKLYNYTNKYVKKLISLLKPNQLVLFHFQGCRDSNPLNIVHLICYCKHVKYIIGHAGCYGGLNVSPPKRYLSEVSDTCLRFYHSIFALQNSIELANLFPHVYLDNTIPCPFGIKGKVMSLTDKFIFGTDFCEYKYANNQTIIAEQYKLLRQRYPDIDIDDINNRFIKWLETDNEILFKQAESEYEDYRKWYNTNDYSYFKTFIKNQDNFSILNKQ